MLKTISPTRSLSTRLTLFTIATAMTAMLALTLLTNAAATENAIATARHQIDTQALNGIERVEMYLQDRRSSVALTAQADHTARDAQAALTVAQQGIAIVGETVQSMTDVRQRVEGIAQTILSLAGQAQAINTITGNVQMAASARQATVGLEQIGQALLSIQKAASETLTRTCQAERAAQNLNALAQSLQQMVAIYRLA